MTCIRNPDGTFRFTYQQVDGLQDSGRGSLRVTGPNRIEGHLVNQLGIKANFVLTR